MVRQLSIRQLIEGKEESLSPYAAKSRLSRGRQVAEEACPVRTAFQRDRDRIIHAKAFRRLKHKTQVFIAPLGDHYVTRLTHTLEVSQIARTITRALNLNEDLAEAISLGHDLGHTPFGHIGEDTLNELYAPGFRHNEQSLRVVDCLEKDGRGLNLTWEVRDGILNHSKYREDSLSGGSLKPGTLEGEICKLADAIAYINHDIGDAIRAGIIKEEDLPDDAITVLGATHSGRINNMVCDVIETSWPASGYGIIINKPKIAMSPRTLAAANALRLFLFDRVYSLQGDQPSAKRARKVIRLLYGFLNENPAKLPEDYRLPGNSPERGVVDYIAGMTDQYAIALAGEIQA